MVQGHVGISNLLIMWFQGFYFYFCFLATENAGVNILLPIAFEYLFNYFLVNLFPGQ